MSFWKSLFSNSDVEVSTPTYDWETVGTGSDRKQYRILFTTNREIDLYELEELCDAVGWARRPLRKVKKALQYSFLSASMWQQKGSRQRLIGFARATSDHTFNATIWDVVVHPEFQNQGLGKALMQYMIRKLRQEEISNITLFADPHVVDFYRGIGFRPDPDGIKGMFWYPD